MDLETVSLSVTPNHRKLRKCCQSRSQEATQIHQKIDKNGHLGLRMSIGCPPGPQDHQNGVQGTQKEPQGVQNSSLKLKKSAIAAINQSASSLQSSSLQSTV